MGEVWMAGGSGAARADLSYVTGALRVEPSAFRVLRAGVPLALEPKAIEVLLMLASRAGAMVSRNDLLDAVWPRVTVTPNVLSRTIAQLRHGIGDSIANPRYIATVHGRGYRWVAPIEPATEDAAVPLPPFGPSASASVPAQLTTFIGREQELADLEQALRTARLLTLVGPGGIGKTRLAIEICRRVGPDYVDGVWFVDLSTPTHLDGALTQIAGAFGVRANTAPGLVPQLAVALAGRRLLLVLDNCDALAEGLGTIISRLVAIAPGLDVVATSQWPLDVDGERLYRVPSLPVPEGPQATEDVASVKLLLDRASAAGADLQLTAATSEAIALLCVRLDGIPLAIELAASRLRVLSLGQLVEGLDARLSLLHSSAAGRPPRQRTLRAMLEWSFGLLDEPERTALSALAVFNGSFDFAAALATVGETGRNPDEFLELLTGLVSKSLVVALPAGRRMRYLLLDSVRAYALELLGADARSRALRDRHLAHYAGLAADLRAAGRTVEQLPWTEWFEVERGNIFEALAWAGTRTAPEARLLGADSVVTCPLMPPAFAMTVRST